MITQIEFIRLKGKVLDWNEEFRRSYYRAFQNDWRPVTTAV